MLADIYPVIYPLAAVGVMKWSSNRIKISAERESIIIGKDWMIYGLWKEDLK